MVQETTPSGEGETTEEASASRRDRLQNKGRVELEGSRAGALLDRLEIKTERPGFQSRAEAVASLEQRRSAKAAAKAESKAAREARGPSAVALSPGRVWLAGTLVAASLGLWFVQSNGENAHQAVLSEARTAQSALVEETEALNAIASLEVDAQRQEEAIGMATGVAEIVAGLQNGFGAFDYSAGEFADWASLDALSAEGGGYFSEGAQIGAKDPTRAWFVKWLPDAEGHNTVAAPADSYGWVASDVYQMDARDQVSVVWLNRDVATGELLAWANGTYSYLDGVFTEVTVGLTALGETHLGEGDHNHDDEEELLPPGLQPPASTTADQEAS